MAHDAAHDSDMSEGTGSSTTPGEPTPDADESTTSNPTSSTATGELPEETTTTSASPASTGESLLQPRILSVDMLPTVHLAGPVDVVVIREELCDPQVPARIMQYGTIAQEAVVKDAVRVARRRVGAGWHGRTAKSRRARASAGVHGRGPSCTVPPPPHAYRGNPASRGDESDRC